MIVDTMNTFHILGFVVDNHTIRFVDIICYVEQFAVLGTNMCPFSQTSNNGIQNRQTTRIHLVVD